MLGPRFHDIERYLSIRLDCDLAQVKRGQPCVVETPRRLQCEPSYDDIRVLWWLQLKDGRSVISVPPGAGDEIRRIINDMPSSEPFQNQIALHRLQDVINRVLAQQGMNAIHRVFSTLVFACNAELFRKHAHGECRRLLDASLPVADGFAWPPYTFLEHILYGVIVDGQVVSVAAARPTGVLENRVVDVGIATALAYQHRGYAKTAVSAITEHIAQLGGEAVYFVRPENQASVATARSVGFVEYAVSLTMRAPTPLVPYAI